MPAPLSPRHYQVLNLVARGLNSHQIGTRLQLSHRTIELYRGNLMRAFKVHNAVALLRAAVKGGYLPGDVLSR